MNFTKTVTKVNWVKLALTIVVIGVVGWLLTFLLLKGISMVKNKMLERKLVDKANAEIKDGDVTLTPSELSNMADRLHAAMAGFGTDEEAIYAVLSLPPSLLPGLAGVYKARLGQQSLPNLPIF